MSDKLQFVVCLPKTVDGDASDKPKFVGHWPALTWIFSQP
jgi:6-phosphofructokinase